MKKALIGYTGFVGGNLRNQLHFDSLYNSKNIEQIQGQEFAEVYCTAAPAVKWMANKEPEQDLASIEKLMNCLKTVTAESFVLISTIDVYPQTTEADESFDLASVDNHPYGKHRLMLENFCRERFDNTVIIRLPALFGEGLKKNVIYDMLNDNGVDQINADSTFQYYDLDQLAADIDRAKQGKLAVANFFTEPLRTGDIQQSLFPDVVIGENAAAEMHYCLKTQHAAMWGRADGFIYGRERVFSQLKAFVAGYDKRTSAGGQ